MSCVDPIQVLSSFLTVTPCTEELQEAMLPFSLSTIEYAKMLTATLLLELPFYHWFLRSKKSFRESAKADLVLNLATHPLVIFVIPLLVVSQHGNFRSFIIIAELFAPLVETVLLHLIWKIPMKRAFAAAFIANLASWWIGTLIF